MSGLATKVGVPSEGHIGDSQKRDEWLSKDMWVAKERERRLAK
jgi:hypothetical protein